MQAIGEDRYGELRNLHAVLVSGKSVWLEPLSRQLFWPEPAWTGRMMWLPKGLESIFEEGACICSIPSLRIPKSDISAQPRLAALRTLETGSKCHVLGIIAGDGSDFQATTGQTAMFWVELFFLTFAAPAARLCLSVVSSCKQRHARQTAEPRVSST